MPTKKYEPSEKSLAMTKFLEKIQGRTTAINGHMCIICHLTVKDFRDEKSEKEYTISGVCQECQDSLVDYMRDLNGETKITDDSEGSND